MEGRDDLKNTTKKIEEAIRSARREINSGPLLVVVLKRLLELQTILQRGEVTPEEIASALTSIEQVESNLEEEEEIGSRAA